MTTASQRSHVESEAEACPPDELLFDFAMGNLAAGERDFAEAHLSQCEDCRLVLAQAALGLSERSPGSAAAEASPRRIGRYNLVELLGAGTSGVVYRAFDPELERVVALKLLRGREDLAEGDGNEQIMREARAMAQLSHPNVVTIFDVGLDVGRVYIVMEYVQGMTLEQWLHKTARAPAAIVAAFVEAGRGLSAAHAKRLAHRDFKPENVLVGRDGRVRVTDFGLARSLGSAESAALSSLKGAEVTTRTRGIFGTPAYMAPELFDGQVANAQSDQFSFCVALLGALMGRHPFGADSDLKMTELFARMQAHAIDFSGTAVPSALRDVLLKGVQAEPAARFGDMPNLLMALESAARRMHHRRFLLAAAAVAFVSAVAIAVTLGRASATRAPPESSIASSPRERSAMRAATLPSSAPVTNDASSAAAAEPVPGDGSRSAESAGVARSERDTHARRKQPARRGAGRKRYEDGLKDPF